MKKLGFASTATASLIALGGTALAQEPTYYEEPVTTAPAPWAVGFALGGGVAGFTDETMRDTTNVGGSWDARITIGTNMPVAFEGSYIGSAQGISALGLDDDAVLVSNGAQGLVRLNGGFGFTIDPFIFGGIAWRRYDIVNEDFNTSAVLDSDDVGEVPLGVGIAGNWGGFMLDVRGEYRYAFDNDLVPSNNDLGDTAEMHAWGVNLSLGYSM